MEESEHAELDREFDEEDSYVQTMPMGQPVIFTPRGPVPIQSTQSFNYWLMHTNFKLTQEILELIEAVPGVEYIDVYSNYRARLAFARLFESAIVKREIQEKLMSFLGEDLIKSPSKAIMYVDKRVTELKEELAKHEFWAILQLPNGSIESTTDKEQAEVFKHASVNVGGVFLSSIEES